MTTTAKVELVKMGKDEHGLGPSLNALDLPRSTWYYHRRYKVSYEDKYAHLRPLLEKIALHHPSYGVLRITTELQKTYNQVVNHKVVQRLLKSWDLGLKRSIRTPKPSRIRQAIHIAGKRANLVAGMDEIRLFEVAYTDFTEILYDHGSRKAQLMPIIGHTCKVVYGWAVGRKANTGLALDAWNAAKATFVEMNIPHKGLVLHHDQDSVYTGHVWTGQLILKDQVKLSYAVNGYKDNPEMESFNGRFKVENHSLFLDAGNLQELREVINAQIIYYNVARRHSSLGYFTPMNYVKKQSQNQKMKTDTQSIATKRLKNRH